MITRSLIVGAGGFIGAVARYAVGVWCEGFWRRPFPLGTFLVNVTGCFILGLFLTLAAERLPIDARLRLFVATGFVGAYTTFSTFEYETQRLSSTGALGWAIVNVLTSVLAGYAAVQLGVALARR
jgi:CrcB protein